MSSPLQMEPIQTSTRDEKIHRQERRTTDPFLISKRRNSSFMMRETHSRRRTIQTITSNMVHEELVCDIETFFVIGHWKVLGVGVSGSVRTCTHRNTGRKFALKTLNKSSTTSSAGDIKQEIRIMAKLDHPNIIRLHEYFETQTQINLVMELCTGGDLLDRLHQQPNCKFPEYVSCRIVRSILSAIRYCHENHIVHRDLKLENFVFASEAPDADIKLIDFGFSSHFRHDQTLSASLGTPIYVAPEVLSKSYSNKCDIWSIGVLSYILLTGSAPFEGINDEQTLVKVKEARLIFYESLFGHISEDAKDFIRWCLTVDESNRPSAEDAQLHNWFSITQLTVTSEPISANAVKRLWQFTRKSLLSRQCLIAVAYSLTEEQKAELRDLFLKFDIHKCGYITLQAMSEALADQPTVLPQDQLRVLFAGLDMERNGRISYHVFLAAALRLRTLTAVNYQLAFDKMSHHSEYITAADIRDLLGKDYSADDVSGLLDELALSSHCQINYSDFKTIAKAGPIDANKMLPVSLDSRGLGVEGRGVSPYADGTRSPRRGSADMGSLGAELLRMKRFGDTSPQGDKRALARTAPLPAIAKQSTFGGVGGASLTSLRPFRNIMSDTWDALPPLANRMSRVSSVTGTGVEAQSPKAPAPPAGEKNPTARSPRSIGSPRVTTTTTTTTGSSPNKTTRPVWDSFKSIF